MTRSHPPSLVTTVERTLVDSLGSLEGLRVVVATSGGPDSMALLSALVVLRRRANIELGAVSIDHGLRPEAADEVELVRRYAEGEDVHFTQVRLSIEAGGNLQARARAARYEALFGETDRLLGPDAFVATAHQFEDRAETVLLRLLRGTSLAGLGVLAPRAGRLLRPLVEVRRSEVEKHLERHGIPFALDPSNGRREFLRVRVRNELLPLLEELATGSSAHLVELAREASEREEVALGLNREQRHQLRRALARPSGPVDVRLPRGLRLSRD